MLQPFIPSKSWVKFDMKLSVKQQSESLGFVTQILTVNWLSFQTIKGTFEPFINLKKQFWKTCFSFFFLVHVKRIPYVTTKFKCYHTIAKELINILLSTSQKWTSFLSHEPRLCPASPTNSPQFSSVLLMCHCSSPSLYINM